MAANGHRAAGPVEVWAARAWNVFNEGSPSRSSTRRWCCWRPGRSASRPTARSRSRCSARSASPRCCRASRSRCAGRALLWLAARGLGPAARAVARPRRALDRRARRLRLLHGRALGLDLLPPAHRRAVDQRPALLAPGADELRPDERQRPRAAAEAADDAQRRHAARRGADGRLGRCGSSAVALLAAALGALAWRSFVRNRLPRYPARAEAVVMAHARRVGRAALASNGGATPAAPLARRVYVIVVDGANRGRLWQADAPVMDRLAREGTEYLGDRAGLPGAHGRLLLLDAHRRDPGRARHALELRAAPGRAPGVDLRGARAPRPQGAAGRHRAPARPVRRGRRALGHVGAADEPDRPLALRRGPARGRGGGPRPARAAAAGGRPARPRARHAQPRVPRPARRDRPPRRRLPRASSTSAASSRTRP